MALEFWLAAAVSKVITPVFNDNSRLGADCLAVTVKPFDGV